MKYSNICGLFVPDQLLNANCSDCNLCMNNTQNRICDESQEDISFPILVNWNIIGKCINKCKYCYGKDIYEMPYIMEKSDLDIIISNLKKIHPKAIVISGGEPLLHPELSYIIDSLNQFTGVIVDTNGILINDEYVELFSKHKTHIRVSLDDHRESINGRIRVSRQYNSTSKIINNIDKLLKNDIPVTVQSVLSPLNKDYIIEFGEYLLNKRIRNWRIHRLIPQDYFNPGDDGKWMRDCVNTISEFAKNNTNKMIIRISNGEHQGKSTINVGPMGIITTRPTNSLEREILGNIFNDNIDTRTILNRIDKTAHLERYYREYATSL